MRVYVTAVDEARTPARLDRYLALLGEGERARYASLQHDATRRRFLIGRALARHALSSCAPVAPDRWRLATAEGGRPEVAGPHLRPRPRFSLAHTAEVVACAVAKDLDVGLDIEPLDARGDGDALAQRLFAPAEAAALAGLTPPERRRRFAEYWTLKEAYLKACGRGLSVPLDTFWFLVAPGAPIRIRFKGALRDRPGRWRFTSRLTVRDHVLSVALAAGPDAPEVPLTVEWCVPLVSS